MFIPEREPFPVLRPDNNSRLRRHHQATADEALAGFPLNRPRQFQIPQHHQVNDLERGNYKGKSIIHQVGDTPLIFNLSTSRRTRGNEKLPALRQNIACRDVSFASIEQRKRIFQTCESLVVELQRGKLWISSPSLQKELSMKKFTVVVVALLFALVPVFGFGADKEAGKDASKDAAKGTPPASTMKTDVQKLSYALGMEIGGSLKGLNTEIDLKAFSKAIEDMMAGKEPQLSKPDAEKVRKDFFEKVQAAHQQKMKEEGEKNKTEGDKFMAENKTKKGVVTTASGLQYMVLTEGKGPKPTADDKVSVHYKGTLLNGTEFDSSYSRNEPVSFPVKGVIPGWTEALQLMPVGSKYKLFIPSKLAYGERGAGQQISPNATLIFEVELLKIEPKEVATPPAAAAPTKK
jgi:FKBP-type peptidyl-prolyl cis-trans isomerase